MEFTGTGKLEAVAARLRDFEINLDSDRLGHEARESTLRILDVLTLDYLSLMVRTSTNRVNIDIRGPFSRD